jgi:carboxylate-amine ligase
VETRVLILELLDFVDDVVDELGSRDQISYASDIKNGTGAAKQLAVFEKTHDITKVVLSQMNSLKAYKLLDYLYNLLL